MYNTGMSNTLLSFVAVLDGVLIDLESVELTDESSLYGVRRVDTGEVIVPAGATMLSSQQGLWTYEFEDPAGGLLYQCAVKITLSASESLSESDEESNERFFTFYRYSPEAPVSDSISESGSESESDSLITRRIDLVRSDLTREAVKGRGDMFRITF